VCELEVGMIADVLFDFAPISGVITYFFTGTTDRKKAAECFYLTKRIFKFDISCPELPVCFVQGK
jgi:hypothetical protein